MDAIPHRGQVATPYRRLICYFEARITLPDINPAIYQLIGIGLSIYYLFLGHWVLKTAVISLILLTDCLDGATARCHGQPQKSGYIADVIIDRASEGIIFIGEIMTMWGLIFFWLWLGNTLLAYNSIRTGKHQAMALRFFFILVLVGQGIGQWLLTYL